MASIKKVPIEKLNPAPYNPRVELKPEDKEYQAIKNSIESFGYLDPIVWNERTGNIVSGHQRYQILKDKGETELEVMVVDFDMDKEKACNLAMNKAVGLWDYGKLDDLLEEMQNTAWDMSEFGFEELGDFDGFGDFSNAEGSKGEGEFSTISLTFPREEADEVKQWITDHSKEEINAIVLEGIRK